MCTSIIYDSNGQHYFGRNLDLEISFGEHPVITPRNYVFKITILYILMQLMRKG